MNGYPNQTNGEYLLLSEKLSFATFGTKKNEHKRTLSRNHEFQGIRSAATPGVGRMVGQNNRSVAWRRTPGASVIDALQNNEPFLVAFAPNSVKGHMHWSWTTHFQEIAGVPVELYYMTPNIFSSKGHRTFRDSNELRKNIKINRFGIGNHRWWCTSSDFKGGSANLYYSGRYGDGQKKVYVTSYTKFPK